LGWNDLEMSYISSSAYCLFWDSVGLLMVCVSHICDVLMFGHVFILLAITF